MLQFFFCLPYRSYLYDNPIGNSSHSEKEVSCMFLAASIFLAKSLEKLHLKFLNLA
jgi:hypothetical protein